MEALRQWTLAVCAAAVVCSILQQLFPDNGVGRQGRLVLTTAFLCVLLSPLSGLNSPVKLPDFTGATSVDSAALTARMRQQLAEQVNATLLAMVNQSLDGYGWSAKKVVADMDIDEEGSIRMGQITVYVDEDVARRAAAVRQVAEKRLGAAVTVAVWEETG